MPLEIEKYVKLWRLTALSEPMRTATSILQKVRDKSGDIRMLKVTADADEMRGIDQLKVWSAFQNSAVAHVFKEDYHAVLLEYAQGSRSLLPAALHKVTHLQSSKKLAHIVYQLHQTVPEVFCGLRTLENVLDGLLLGVFDSQLLQKAQNIAKELLISSTSNVPLHGDAHHNNMLYFSGNQLRAIDPKGFQGEHYFDYLPIFINPDLGDIRMDKSLFEEKLQWLCHHRSFLLERMRLMQWIFVGAALSAVWFLEDQFLYEADQQLRLLQWILDEGLL